MDTNVLAAGACRHEESLAYRVLIGVLRREIPLMLTVPIALEYHEVMQRPAIMALTGLDHQQSADLVTILVSVSREVQIHFSWRPNLADESDNKFVEAAIHTGAAIVTYNKRDFTAADIPQWGWTAMTPAEFVGRYL
jgi:predicted nucleic acid-binding protein